MHVAQSSCCCMLKPKKKEGKKKTPPRTCRPAKVGAAEGHVEVDAAGAAPVLQHVRQVGVELGDAGVGHGLPVPGQPPRAVPACMRIRQAVAGGKGRRMHAHPSGSSWWKGMLSRVKFHATASTILGLRRRLGGNSGPMQDTLQKHK